MAITQTSKSLAKGRWPIGCFLTFFMLFGLGMSFVFLWPLVEIVQATGWREVPCTILTSEVESHRGSKGGSTYSVAVTYEYFVDDERHVGTRYKFMGGSSSGYEAKQEIVDRLKPGTRAVCYVNRRNADDSVIERGFTADLLFGFIPLLFAAIGAGGLYATFFSKRRLPPPGAAPGVPAASAAKGAVTLKSQTSPAMRFGCMLAFAVFWNSIISVFVAETYSGWRAGHADGCRTVFMIPFVLVGLGLLVGCVYGFLALFNPRPTIKLSSGVVALGDLLEVEWQTEGSVSRVRSFSITLEGREEATHGQGKGKSTDKSTFAVIELARSKQAKELRRGKAKFTVPADSMHSFKSDHNKFVWAIHVKGEIPWWPDVGEEFPIEVLPQPLPPGAPA
jgi:hypothetical protein